MTLDSSGNNSEKLETENDDQEEKSVDSQQYLAEDFEGLADNIYEAIIVVAKRARKVGDGQKKEIDRQIGTLDLTDTSEEEQHDEDEPEPDFYHYEKPTIIAMRELKTGQLKYQYKK